MESVFDRVAQIPGSCAEPQSVLELPREMRRELPRAEKHWESSTERFRLSRPSPTDPNNPMTDPDRLVKWIRERSQKPGSQVSADKHNAMRASLAMRNMPPIQGDPYYVSEEEESYWADWDWSQFEDIVMAARDGSARVLACSNCDTWHLL